MLYRKFILAIGLTFNAAIGQSIFQAYGLGMVNGHNHSSSQGLGGGQLIPSFRPQVSLDNPSTWHHLKFAHLIGHVNSQHYSVNADAAQNRVNLGAVQFVVPIHKKYALGFSLKPLSSQRAYFAADSTLLNFEEDSLYFQKEARSGGGISALSTAFSFPVSNKIQAGIKVDALFGSSQEDYLLRVNGVDFRKIQQKSYKGILFQGSLNGEALQHEKFKVHLYGGVGGTINPLSTTVYDYHPFEDSNGNYFYDSNDFPDSVAVDTSVLRYSYSPKYFTGGIDVSFNNGWHVSGEGQLWRDEAIERTGLSIFSDQIAEKTRINFGVAKFPVGRTRGLLERLYYRGGIFKMSHGLKTSGKIINESGLSVGLGLKFGITDNQIDLSYRVGKRSIPGDLSESFQELSIGLSLGDVWFLKRRTR